MCRLLLIGVLFAMLIPFHGQAQETASPGNTVYTYHHPSTDKQSWQRLYLNLSATFLVVKKEGQVDMDTCLIMASRSLGLSRFPVLAEGLDASGLLQESQWMDHGQPQTGIQLLARATGKKQLLWQLLLGAYYAFQPDSYRKCRDSAQYFLSRALLASKELNEKRLGRQALCLLGKMYVQVNDPRGDSIFNQLIEQSRQAGDRETEARAFAWRGRYKLPRKVTFAAKVADLRKASELYQSIGNTEEEINVRTALGYMLVVSGQVQAAGQAFLKALNLAEASQFPYTHYLTESLALIHILQGKFGEPLRYELQTIKVAENCRDSIGWGYFYSRLSELYDFESTQQQSIDMAQKAIQRFVIERNPTVYHSVLPVIGYMIQQGQAKQAQAFTFDIIKKVGIPSNVPDLFFYNNALATCYTFNHKLDLAEMHARKMDSLEIISETVRGPYRRTAVNDLLAIIAFKRRQYLKAKEGFQKRFTITSIGDRNLSGDLFAYQWLISIDSALGDNASLITHYQKYTQLLDSNFKVSKIRQAEELQVLYETQEKEKQIASLNQEAALQRENFKQATKVKNLTLAGIAAVIIIAGLLYRQNRLKHQSNKQINQKNEQLQHLLTDREWLLKEIHHRVKNNLQIVMSLLNSQAVYINNHAALNAIQDSKRRVYAMSLIHQKLYQSKNVASIAMPGYINELVNHVQDSFDTGKLITFQQHIEPLDLDVSQAIPLGLILNECIVNAIKYAFPDQRKGIVHIALKHDGEEHLLLDIADNGIGLPADLDHMERNSLGLDLVRGLTKQLKGCFASTSHNGLHITIRFPVISKQIAENT